MRCDYAHDDGAYVLGALSPAERSDYERHLATCPACREAVAEIAVLPGLLGRLDTATALQLLAEDPEESADRRGRPQPVTGRGNDEDARVVSLLGAAVRTRRQERRGRRLRYATAALAAACVAVLAMIGVGMLNGGDLTRPGNRPAARMEAMTPVDQELPVTAEVGLEKRGWGTEVTMECSYEKTDRYRKPWRLRLMAYGPNNESEQVSSWVATPGEPVSITGATRFSADQLVRLALVRDDGMQLLTYDVP